MKTPHLFWYSALLSSVVFITLSVTGCGNDDASSSPTLQGTVIDGYLRDAKICVDRDSSATCDSGEPYTLSQTNGKYTLPISESDRNTYPLVAEGTTGTFDEGTNAYLGKPLTLMSPAGMQGIITPITTMVQTEIKYYGKTLDEAKSSVAAALGISVDDLGVDYVAQNNTTLATTASNLATQLQNSDNNFTQVAQDNGIAEDNATSNLPIIGVLDYNDIDSWTEDRYTEALTKTGTTTSQASNILNIKSINPMSNPTADAATADAAKIAAQIVPDLLDPVNLVLAPLQLIGDIFTGMAEREQADEEAAIYANIMNTLAYQQDEINQLQSEIETQADTFNSYVASVNSGNTCNAFTYWSNDAIILSYYDTNTSTTLSNISKKMQCENQSIDSDGIFSSLGFSQNDLVQSDFIITAATNAATMQNIENIRLLNIGTTNNSADNSFVDHIEHVSGTTTSNSNFVTGNDYTNVKKNVNLVNSYSFSSAAAMMKDITQCTSVSASEMTLTQLLSCQLNILVDEFLPTPDVNSTYQNFREILAQYNNKVLGIYQQSAYALQSAFVLESTTNMLNLVNYTAACFDNNQTAALTQIGSWEFSAGKNVTDYISFSASSCAAYSSITSARDDFKNKQKALASLYAARFNGLYKNTLHYTVSDTPLSIQTYTTAPSGKPAQSDFTATLNSYDLSNQNDNVNGGQRIPVNYLASNAQGVFYQYQNINNVYGCIDKGILGYDYNASESNVSTATCTSAFPDTNASYYDGASLQVYVPQNDGNFALSYTLDLGLCSVTQPVATFGPSYATDTDDTYLFNGDTLWCRKPFGPNLTQNLVKSSNWPSAFNNMVFPGNPNANYQIICRGISYNSDGSTSLFPTDDDDCNYCTAGGSGGTYIDGKHMNESYQKVWLSSDTSDYPYIIPYASNTADGSLALATPEQSSNPTAGDYTVGFFRFTDIGGTWNTASDYFLYDNDNNDFQHTALVAVELNGYRYPFYMVNYEYPKSSSDHTSGGVSMQLICAIGEDGDCTPLNPMHYSDYRNNDYDIVPGTGGTYGLNFTTPDGHNYTIGSYWSSPQQDSAATALINNGNNPIGLYLYIVENY